METDPQENPVSKVVRTYSKEIPYSQKLLPTIETEVSDTSVENSELGNLGTSLAGSTSIHVLGESLVNNSGENLGVSLLESVSGNAFNNTSNSSDVDLQKDPYSFDIFEDETPSELCAPLFTSTPKKTVEPRLDIEEDNTIHNESLDLTTSTLVDDTDSNIQVDIDELTSCIATPKIQTRVTAEGRTSTLLMEKYTTPRSIHDAMRSGCCDKRCIQTFSYTDIKNCRIQFWSKSVQKQNLEIYEKLRCGQVTLGKLSLFEMGKKICTKAFRDLFMINKNRFSKLRRKFRDGHRHAERNDKQRSVKYLEAMNWLETYAFYRADDSPDSDKKLLPYKTRKILVYKNYMDERREMDLAKIKKSTFFKMWKTDFPNLRIKEVNSFSRCTKCTSIGRQLEKLSLSPNKKKALLIARNEHNHRQMMERQYYYKKREAAKRAPNKFLSLIVDGMDQSKSNLPHFVGRTAKAVNAADQLKTHISGVIAHGQNEFYTFLDVGQYPHDSNLTINIIIMVLFRLKDKMGGKLPPVLYIQADNCWRENKNKFMLSFCEYLVKENIFKEVHLSFLMVGHTHEDIDACFSKVSDILRRNDAETLDDLVNLLPNVTNIKYVFDVRSWIEDNIRDVRKHTQPLHYKFKNSGHVVEAFYKGKHDSAWKNLDGGLLVRNQHQTIVKIRGSPKLSSINFDGIGLEKIESHLKFWKCLFSDQIDQTQFQWWKNYIQMWKKCKENVAECRRQFFVNAQWLLPKLPKHDDDSESEEDCELPDTIQNMMDAEVMDPVVVIK